MPHKTPAIRYWSSDNIKDRDSFEFENGGFGILNLYEKDNDANDSFENKAKEDKELHHMQKRKQSENELDRRQKRRVEEVRESEKKKEECINLKEQYRIEVRERLTRLERRSFNFRSFLANVGLHIAEADYEIKSAYKKAAKIFHPDRAPKDDLYKQVEAEETFKVIQRMKDEKDPPIIDVSE
ncbi:dnaJ domain-containing protein [Artemisia annua]|uniref:DnaJ domain-containing protein n=1 Tax=Artemisia annua TaxID=35608 RepID=A0A2U1Q8L0_ARTAN|nr:dnaJ domain-containing protein [Artemisia annua]